VSVDWANLAWRKSTSSSEIGNCVEVANSGSTVFLRNSRHPSGPTLSFTADEWRAFLAGVRANEFDLISD
jgi:hypothetical protein